MLINKHKIAGHSSAIEHLPCIYVTFLFLKKIPQNSKREKTQNLESLWLRTCLICINPNIS